uniref:AAA_11 domain-containing protein n=1 Tax=Parastrongyloides trichosuri TaxID=131310 RepID=A0A0N4ZZQ5_PARTI
MADHESRLTTNKRKTVFIIFSGYPVSVIEAPTGTGKTQTIASAALTTLNEIQFIVCNTNSAAKAVVVSLKI